MKTELKIYKGRGFTKRVIVDGHAIGFISMSMGGKILAIISPGMGRFPASSPAFSCETEAEAVAILEKVELQSQKMLEGL